MAKYAGLIGFSTEEETSPGVWEKTIKERPYKGDVVKRFYRTSSASDKLNSNTSISNEFSILGDPFAYENFHLIEYLTYMGVRWAVTSVDVAFPRLTLSIGGVYNGPQNRAPKDVGTTFGE